MKPPGASALAQDHPTGLPDPDPGFLRNNLARVSMCSADLLLVHNPTDLHWIPTFWLAKYPQGWMKVTCQSVQTGDEK